MDAFSPCCVAAFDALVFSRFLGSHIRFFLLGGDEILDAFFLVTDKAAEDDVVDFDPFVEVLDAVSQLL